jgi:nitrogen PTS system EIIA component
MAPWIKKWTIKRGPAMTIADIIPDESAILELRGRETDEVLAELATELARRSELDPERLLERLHEREALGSTALGHGFALPHTKADVARTLGVLGLARDGVEFASPDGAPVRVFLALVSPPHPSEHLRALACVSRSFGDPNAVERILACPDPTSILALLDDPTA